jgi:RimJ/RimL family protein N-acetyltransferase
MQTQDNDLSQWKAPDLPQKIIHYGQYCQLEPLDKYPHLEKLWHAFTEDQNHSLWDYLAYGPFLDLESLKAFVEEKENIRGEQFFIVINSKTKEPLGFIAYGRLQPEAGSLEIGHVCFSPRLKRTTLATEAVYLLIDHCFQIGYRRCEWKCNALNINSKRAAERFGFQYEGCFRQATVVKGKNRDTDWYSIIDKEWPNLKLAYERWLSAANFDEYQQQIQSLDVFIKKYT